MSKLDLNVMSCTEYLLDLFCGILYSLNRKMLSRLKSKTILVAAILAMTSFEAAIYLDGIISGFLHQAAEYLFTAAIFVDSKSTLIISLISSALAHAISALVMGLGVLWYLKVNIIFFVTSYTTATALYLGYKASLYGELDVIIIMFILTRFIFHLIWMPVWFVFFNQQKAKPSDHLT